MFTVRATPEQQDFFLATILPAVQRVASRRCRELPPQAREDVRAEAVAQAWCAFLVLLEKGRDVGPLVGALAVFSVRKALCGHRLPRTAKRGERPDHDPLSWKGQRRHNLHRRGLDSAESKVLRRRESSVPVKVAFKLDFNAWLSARPQRERALIAELAVGGAAPPGRRTPPSPPREYQPAAAGVAGVVAALHAPLTVSCKSDGGVLPLAPPPSNFPHSPLPCQSPRRSPP